MQRSMGVLEFIWDVPLLKITKINQFSLGELQKRLIVGHLIFDTSSHYPKHHHYNLIFVMFLLQLIADTIHLGSFLILLQQIKKKKSVEEISYRTMEMFLVVYIFRYSDLFIHYISLYNTVMKILYITLTGYLIFLIKFKMPYCLSYDKNLDNFNHYKFLYPTAIVLTIIFHYNYVLDNNFETIFYKYLLSFSLWIEALAIIP